MRLVFMALLSLNVAFFAWARWIDEPARLSATSAPDPSIPPLQLIRTEQPTTSTGASTAEAGADAASLAAVAASAATTAPPALRCRSLGPFDDEAAAAAAAERLRARGWTARERTIESTSTDGYWVYIGYLKDAAAQRHMIASLNAAGIRDAAAMTAPEQSDRVSLGIFADQARAMRRAEQVRELGFKPMLQVHQRTVNQRWLDFDRKAADADPEPAEMLSGSLALQVTDCPAKTASG